MAAEGAAKPRRPARRLDFATFGGFLLALLGIVGGLILEGGRIGDILQVTAALIVLGGTLGAVMINAPMRTIVGAMWRLEWVFFEKSKDPEQVIAQIIDYATRTRKNGIVSLETEADTIEDPFLKKALNLAVDGTDLQEIRKMLEVEITQEEKHVEAEAKIFEAAGGYSPTIGIIGAVMGLIQVMKNLADIEHVGHGIAVSFVATVYGVGLANIVLLPVANKIKARAHQEAHIKEMILEGILGIVEGMNPKLIRSRLEPYAPPTRRNKKQADTRAAAAAARQEA